MNEQHIFLNRQVSLEGLPQVEQLVYAPLRRQYQRLRLLATVISTGIMLVGSGIALSIASVPAWVPLAAVGFWLLIMVISLVFVIKGFPHMGYAIRQCDIVYKHG
ncbi:MAG: hypothetical protein R3330_01555, partial [Saprospiraceae bacterium]|nr:hypothetical protein [Saprospiraceae bacterium]